MKKKKVTAEIRLQQSLAKANKRLTEIGGRLSELERNYEVAKLNARVFQEHNVQLQLQLGEVSQELKWVYKLLERNTGIDFSGPVAKRKTVGDVVKEMSGRA